MCQTLEYSISLKQTNKQTNQNLLLELKTPMINNPVIAGDFHTPLSPLDRTSGQKINRKTSELNDNIYQI